MKGGAKSRKRLTKKSQNYGYTAPRLKDGIMTRPSVYTYDPSVNIMDRNTAATNIQSRYRGKKTRNKYNMNSKWYKGFPTEAPKERLNLEIISRISDAAIQGFDSRIKRDYYDSKRRQINDRYQSELDKLGKLDESKYNWGQYYMNATLNGNSIPKREDKELLRFEKKNYESLKKLANKKKYWQQQLEKSGKSTNYRKYDPNRVIDSERFNIRSYAADAYQYPEKYEDMFEAYYKGRYYDPDIDDYRYLSNYKVEDMPSLSPIREDDSIEYSEDDELLLPREEIIDATDYYKTRKIKQDKLDKRHRDYMAKYDKLDVELDNELELDIEKCLHAKKLAKTDIKLLKDPFFIENYYNPCNDNKNLTEIYIETFYSLPWELIKPVSQTKFGETIDDMIHHIPTTQWKNGLITRSGQYILRGILREQGLLNMVKHPHNFVEYSRGSTYHPVRSPFETLLLLSNFYRWATPRSIQLVNLEGKPTIHSNLSGRKQLQMTFNDLDEAFYQHPEEFNNNVEKVKRYFILRLIGIIGNPEYPEILQNFIDRKNKQIEEFKKRLEGYNKQLENYTKSIKDIYTGFEYEGDKIDMDKFISEYKRGLLGGLTQEDDETMFYLTGQMDEIKSEISKSEKKLLKLEKDLETAKRFSRIKGMPKDYMTWEAEKLVYD